VAIIREFRTLKELS